ncbi:MAG: DUF4252 domain-containing protein [Aureispira sp.]
MKYLFVISFCLLTWSMNAQNAIEKYFQQYEDDDAFTSVYVSEHMFGLFADLEIEDDEDAELVKVIGGLKSLHILTTEKAPKQYYQEALKRINRKEYEVLMKIKDDGTNLQFLIKKNGNIIEELLLLVEGDEFVLMSIVGTIDLKKISGLAKHVDIEGLEHLEQVKNAE